MTTDPAVTLTPFGQCLLVCVIVGAAVVISWIVRGAVVIVALLVCGLWVALILTARLFVWIEDAHARGIMRLERAGLRRAA